MEFDLETPLPIHLRESEAETIMASLFDIESDHTPSSCTYPQNILRGQIMSLISKSSQEKYDPFLSYLAVNYLDRFLSTQPILEEKPWILSLVAFSCLSLAMKMTETTDDSSVSDIKIQQHNGGIIFDSRTVRRMEFLILDSLKWRMRSVTPFCFINFFISLFEFKDPPSTKALKSRATEIILTAQNDATSLDFRPSIISASALLSASHELFPLQFQSFRQAILDCSFVNKESFGNCYSVVQEITMEGYKSVLDMVSSSSTPANVLDLECWSCCSTTCTSSSDNELSQESNKKKKKTTTAEDQGTAMAAASTAVLRVEKDLKRRKIGNQNAYNHELSRTQHC